MIFVFKCISVDAFEKENRYIYTQTDKRNVEERQRSNMKKKIKKKNINSI